MAFQNKDINDKIKILNETLLNIFNNFIPNKVAKFDYKKPVWMNKEITLLLKKRSNLIKKYYNDATDHNKNLMVGTANECTRLIIAAKEKHLSRLSPKLEDPSTSPKTYWSILNRFLKVIRSYPLYRLSLLMTGLFQISLKRPSFSIPILLLNVLQ